MQIGMVGLGKMGANMTQRLIEKGHQVVAFDLSADGPRPGRRQGRRAGGHAWRSWSPARRRPGWSGSWSPPATRPPRPIDTLARLHRIAATSSSTAATPTTRRPRRPTRRSPRRASAIVDAGTSGGVWGLANGYCLMVGGDHAVGGHGRAGLPRPGARGRLRARRARRAPAISSRWSTTASSTGCMQAYAEGFEIMPKRQRVRPRPARDRLDLALRVGGALLAARAGRAGPARRARASRPSRAYVVDSGEGRWTVEEAVDRGVPGAGDHRLALRALRLAARTTTSTTGCIAALRNQFGGHAVVTEPTRRS